MATYTTSHLSCRPFLILLHTDVSVSAPCNDSGPKEAAQSLTAVCKFHLSSSWLERAPLPTAALSTRVHSPIFLLKGHLGSSCVAVC